MTLIELMPFDNGLATPPFVCIEQIVSVNSNGSKECMICCTGGLEYRSNESCEGFVSRLVSSCFGKVLYAPQGGVA